MFSSEAEIFMSEADLCISEAAIDRSEAGLWRPWTIPVTLPPLAASHDWITRNVIAAGSTSATGRVRVDVDVQP